MDLLCIEVPLALCERSVVGPRASVFSPDKDGEAGDVGFIVDTAGCRQAEEGPLEARSGLPTEPSFHLLRGGNWRNWASVCRSATRFKLHPDFRSNSVGFRVVMEVE